MNSQDRVSPLARGRYRVAGRAISVVGLALAFLGARAGEAPPPTNWVESFILQLESGRQRGAPPLGYELLWKEGKVSVTPFSGKENKDAPKGLELQPRDQLSTPTGARAIVLQIAEATAVHEQTKLRVTEDNNLELLSGTVYLKSLDSPTSPPKIQTPTGLVEWKGTEFQITATTNGATYLWLSDGSVTMSNLQGAKTFNAPAGSAAGGADHTHGVMEPGKAPEDSPAVKTFNHIIQWVLYYPAILDLDELPPGLAEDPALQASLAAYRTGDLQAARDAYPTDRFEGPSHSAADTLYRAALHMAFGEIDDVEVSLAPLMNAPPAEPAAERARRLARAFQTLIAAVRNDRLDHRTPAAALQLRTELLAESYYLQSRSEARDNIQQALRAAQAAAQTNAFGEFGFALGRVADLEFSRGHTEAAQAALRQGRRAAPENPHLLVLEGYLSAAAGRVKEAQDSFEQAVAKDGRLGDAWLGLGLCLIRQGQTEAGLRFLQMAVAREPQRATLKSYLAKGYQLQRRHDAALKELKSAQRTDPQDPTPWLYSALLKRDQNLINDAIFDLERSKELNDNRMLFRSRALLDQDRAVRSANLAGLYRDAGMTDVSVREATRAVTSDYGNASAHLFLANSYDALRDPRQITLRYESPWLNELLIAQLMQPIGSGSLSQTVSQQEYSRLFQQDGLGLYSRTQYTSQGDWVQSASQYGTLGTTDYSVDTFYSSLNGTRPNDDFRGLTVWGKIKQQLTPDDTVLLQAVYYDAEGGDNRQLYSPTNALTGYRFEENQEPILLLGYHHFWSPENQTLFLAGWMNDSYHASDPRSDTNAVSLLFLRDRQNGYLPGYGPVPFRSDRDYDSELNLFSAELQHIWQLDRFTTIAGVRYQYAELDTSSHLSTQTGLPFFPVIVFDDVLADQHVDSTFDRLSAYVYENWEVIPDWLTLVAGVAYDRVHYPINHRSAPISTTEETRDQVSPKGGLILTPPGLNTTLRASYTRSLGGLSFDQSFRLEPTQVAGFVQSYRDLMPQSVVGSVPAPEFETVGVLLDHRFRTRTYAAVGVERLASTADQYGGAFDSYFGQPITPATLHNELDYEERSLGATVNQLVGSCWSLGARYRLSETELEQTTDNPLLRSGTSEAILHSLDGFVLLNLRCGFFSEFQALWRQQSNRGYTPDRPGDSFAQFNLFAGYRFFDRRAEVRLGVLNLSDQDYQLNPLSFYAELPRERMVYASLKLDF